MPQSQWLTVQDDFRAGQRRLPVFILINHQACRYNLTGNSWTGTYLAWVTFDDVTVGAVGGAATTPSRGLLLVQVQ